MKRAASRRIAVLFLLALGHLALIPGAAHAAEDSVAAIGPLSEGAATPEVRAALRGEGYRVRAGDTVAELWLVAELAAGKADGAKPGVNFAGVADGALLGVVRFEQKWSDYRGHSIPAGTYTLRYSVQPDDGDHMGVSEYLDFAVLLPALRDTDARPIGDRKALYAAGAQASGRSHPGVMYLLSPGKSAAGSIERRSSDTVSFVATPGTRTMGFVLRGRTDAE